VAGIGEPGETTTVDAGGGVQPTIAPVDRGESLGERVEVPSERDELLGKVHRLEAELARHRARSERTSKLLLSATSYADWVRERARHDGEVALRKVNARVRKLTLMTRELEATEQELVRLKGELSRLQTLTETTRAQLSAFLTAGLEVVNSSVDVGVGNGPDPDPDNLDDTLRRQLPSTLFTMQRQTPSISASEPEPVPREDAGPPEEF
jgi:hypothetical protein